MSSSCKICQDYGHSSSSCKDLYSDLNEGFYSGGGSGDGHGHYEEEDERLCIETTSGNLDAQCCNQTQGSKAGH